MFSAKAFVCRRLLPGACLLFVAGCLFNRKPPTSPLVPAQAVLVKSDHFVGTPLTGPLAQTPATVNPADALSMEVTLTAVERVPAMYRGTLGSSARMIVATRGSVPLRPTAVLARSAGFASGINAEKLDVAMAAGKFGRVVPLSHTFTALPAGTTALFDVRDAATGQPGLAGGPGSRRAGIEFHRPQVAADVSASVSPSPATAPNNTIAENPTTAPAAQPSTVPSGAPATVPSTAPATQPDAHPANRAVATNEPTTLPAVATAIGPTKAPATSPDVVTGPTAGAEPSGVQVELAVVLADYAPDISSVADSSVPGAAADAAPRTAAQPMLQQETILLDPRTVIDSLTLAVVLPFRFRDGKNESVVAVIHIRRGSSTDARHEEACRLALVDLQRSSAAAIARGAAMRPATPDASGVDSALAALGDAKSRRPALVYLAGWSGARICEDVALSADEQALAKVAAGVSAALSNGPRDKPSVAWAMDRASLDLLAKLQVDNQLPPELAAVLSDRAGEVGRHPSAMEEILRDVAGPDDLAQRILATNTLYLEDSSPASRARAFQWLRAAGRAPAGYDPMGAPRERRAALEKAATQPADPANPGGSP